MKNTCKIVSALLSVVFVLTVATPVFAETKNSTVSYEVSESFTWSVTESVTVGDDIDVTILSANLVDGSYVTASITSSDNGEYDDWLEEYRFRVKANNRSDLAYAYYCVQAQDEAPDGDPGYQDVKRLNFVVADTRETGNRYATVKTSWSGGQAPTYAGTYTDKITFTAEIHSAN